MSAARFEPHYAGLGLGWIVVERSGYAFCTAAGPFTSREHAQEHADRLNAPATPASMPAGNEAPAPAVAGASEVARNALLLTFERYDAILADLSARIALHEVELEELRSIVGDDGTAHSVAV